MSTPQDFVDFPLAVTNIGSTPIAIFIPTKPSILQSILVANLVDEQSKVYVYILRTVDDVTTKYILANGITIEALDRKDILERTLLNIQLTDVLYAYSDFSTHKLTSFISFEQLNEL